MRAQFESRDWFAIEHHDPYLALVELCLRERAQTTRAAWGLQRMEKIALVVLHPLRWPAGVGEDLLHAAARCLPTADLFTADDDEVQPWRAGAAVESPGRPAAGATAAVASQPPPSLQAATQRASLERPSSPMERVSFDEMDMLLRDDGEDQQVGDVLREAPR